jgi:hypothetical protein
MDDGMPCTVDACVAGEVTHTANDQLCDDGNECTADSCIANGACENLEIAGCGAGYALDPTDTMSSIKAGNCPGLGEAISCPIGAVAVGYEGQSGSWMDHVHLHCRTLEPDGSLGNLTVTAQLGTSSSGNEFGAKACPNGMVMVGSITKVGDKIDSVQGMCHPVSAVANSAGTYTELAPKAGGNGGSTQNQPCAPGYVVTGMIGPQETYPCRLEWVCTALSNQ